MPSTVNDSSPTVSTPATALDSAQLPDKEPTVMAVFAVVGPPTIAAGLLPRYEVIWTDDVGRTEGGVDSDAILTTTLVDAESEDDRDDSNKVPVEELQVDVAVRPDGDEKVTVGEEDML